MNRVLIDPTEEEVFYLTAEATESANQGAKVRLAKQPPITEVTRTASGRVETNGGGVPSTHGFPAQTSRIGLAWWTDGQGRKHVRVVSDRVNVSNRTVGSVFGPNAQAMPDFWCVYPGTAEIKKVKGQTALILTCGCGRKGDIRELAWDGERCGVCRDTDRYENETGFRPGVGR